MINKYVLCVTILSSFHAALPQAVYFSNTSTMHHASIHAAYRGIVTRVAYANLGDAIPQLYTGIASACSLNLGNGDNGSQIKALDGCWVVIPNETAYDPREFGATGLSNDNVALAAADLAASTAGYAIYMTGNLAIASDYSMTSALKHIAGEITPANGVTFTMAAPPSSNNLTQIFDISLGGKINFTVGGNIYPEWFGSVGSGVTDDANAINAALNAIQNSGGTVWFNSAKSYSVCSSPVWIPDITTNYVALKLDTYGGRQEAPGTLTRQHTLQALPGCTSGLVAVVWDNSQSSYPRVDIEDINVTANGVAPHAIWLANGNYHLDNMHIGGAIGTPGTALTDAIPPQPFTGSGYLVGDNLTPSGGTCSVAPSLTVATINGSGAPTSYNGLGFASAPDGNCSVQPGGPQTPVALTGGHGTGATAYLVWETNESVAPWIKGSGYSVGETCNVADGTYTTPAQVKIGGVDAVGGASAIYLTNSGTYSVLPVINTAHSLTGCSGGGSGAQVLFGWMSSSTVEIGNRGFVGSVSTEMNLGSNIRIDSSGPYYTTSPNNYPLINLETYATDGRMGALITQGAYVAGVKLGDDAHNEAIGTHPFPGTTAVPMQFAFEFQGANSCIGCEMDNPILAGVRIHNASSTDGASVIGGFIGLNTTYSGGGGPIAGVIIDNNQPAIVSGVMAEPASQTQATTEQLGTAFSRTVVNGNIPNP